MLTYDIARQRLFGAVGKTEFNLFAVSGGGRGSKIHPYGDPNDKGSTKGFGSWNFRRQEVGQVRGGPVPPGFYIIHKPAQHPPLGLAAYLEQTLSSLVYQDPTKSIGISVTTRDGFYIHGRGPKGSDGCIVPMEQFQDLMKALEENAPLPLHVINPGMPASDFDSTSIA